MFDEDEETSIHYGGLPKPPPPPPPADYRLAVLCVIIIDVLAAAYLLWG